jgi:hypothetical protein
MLNRNTFTEARGVLALQKPEPAREVMGNIETLTQPTLTEALGNPESSSSTSGRRGADRAARWRSIPTLVVINDSEVIGASPGVVGADQLVAALDQLASTAATQAVPQEGAPR